MKKEDFKIEYEAGEVVITKDNIHLYYDFMSYEDKREYKEILDHLLVKRKNIINDILFSAYYDRFKGGYSFKDIGRYRIEQTIFGVKDTLKPIDEYIAEIKESEAYKEYFISSELFAYCKDYITHSDMYPLDIGFNIYEENEFFIYHKDFIKYLSKNQFDILNSLLEDKRCEYIY